MPFGLTPQGFVLKRAYDIKQDIVTALSAVTDSATGESLTLDLLDENDPIVQLVDTVTDQLSACWEQLQMVNDQWDPLKSTGVGLSGLVQVNGLLRRTSETDTQLRLRRELETSFTSYRQVEAIFAAIIDIPQVQFCRVYVNSTLDIDSRGLPGKAVAAVVVGGDDQAIAEALFNKAPLGLGYFGNTTKTCTTAQGFSYAVAFMRPTLVPIHITVNLQLTDNTLWPYNGADLVQAAIIAYSQYGFTPQIGLPPGQNVLNTRLYTPINSVPGHKILSVLMARGIDDQAPVDIAIDWDEVAHFTEGTISVTLS